MTNIYEKIDRTLSALGYPVREHGTYKNDAKLPDTHLTYQLLDSVNGSHADNAPTSVTHLIQVTFYSKNPALKQGADAAIKAVMLPAKFLRVRGRDLPHSEKTGHYAYTCDYRFYDLED